MDEVCVICGTSKRLQNHHICYDPPMVVTLCVDCHQKVHKHGVGGFECPSGGVFEYCEEEIRLACEGGATNKEISCAFGIRKTTVGKWRVKHNLPPQKLQKTPPPIIRPSKDLKLSLECQRCRHKWEYRGRNIYYATCPHCRTKVSVMKGKEVKE